MGSRGGKGKGIATPSVDQLSDRVSEVSLDSSQDGDWEVFSKKSKNRAGSSAARTQWGLQNSAPKAWGHHDTAQKLGIRGNGGPTTAGNNWPVPPVARGFPKPQQQIHGGSGNTYVAPPPLGAVKWSSIVGSTQSGDSEDSQSRTGSGFNPFEDDVDADVIDDDDDDDGEDTDDDLLSDDFDSDSSEKSHETRKKSKWFSKFFEMLDKLTIEEVNEAGRMWHCPACQNGPGAIDWYRGLQPLMTHARTKGSKRVRLHRELAELLDEELQRRGTSVIPSGEAFGKWKGLKDTVKDHEIVWPPMVMIMNTQLEQDENEKWTGMGNKELLDYFHKYAAAKARHSYGPKGHRGMSLLIFESSARGYMEAERLHKHFSEQGNDRDAWDRRRQLFYPGGQRQLYGYLALKEDIDIFNHHSQGKAKLKFEMRSYHEMVVSQIHQMSEENQQLIWFQHKLSKEHRQNKALKESLDFVSQKLRQTTEENRIVRQRTKMQHDQNKEEMDYHEQFFKERIKNIHEQREAKEEDFEKLQQEQREKVKQSTADPSADRRRRAEEIAKFVKFQEKEMEVFVEERENLIKKHEDKMAAMKRRHWEEEVELEKEYNAELKQLMEKYTPEATQ